MAGRVDVYLVCGGRWHDFDFARLELLKLLAADEHVRVRVAQDFGDTEAIGASEALVSYTCDVRPTDAQATALKAWVEGGGRWLALHGTSSFLDPPSEASGGLYSAPAENPTFFEVLGNQFLSHPAIGPFPVTVSPGAADDPLVQGIGPFEAHDELYLCRYQAGLVPLLETRWTGTTHGFADAEWPDDDPRLVLYRRPLGQGEVLYFTLGHCRSRFDMTQPGEPGPEWPTTDRWSWEMAEYLELLRRGLGWATGVDTLAST